jgi:hypothetical protein
MRRRAFITLLGGAATWPLDAIAQQSAEVRCVGVLANEPWPPLEGLRDGMRGLGYIENQSLHFEYRFAEGRAERFPAFAAELVCLPIRLWQCSGRATRMNHTSRSEGLAEGWLSAVATCEFSGRAIILKAVRDP